MLKRLSPKLSFANVMSVVAVFIALGGVGYAATRLPKNSVGTKQIKPNAVNGSKVGDGTLSAADIGGAVADSLHAANADNAAHALNADHAANSDHAGNADHASQADTATSAGNADTLDGSNSTAFARKGSEEWHPSNLNDGSADGAVAVHAACHWTAYGNGYNEPAYYRDNSGSVHLRGVVRMVSGATYACGAVDTWDHRIFPLPPGYRPPNIELLATISNQHIARINVVDGYVTIELSPSYSDAMQWVSLDGLTFRCGPSGANGCP
jgi:hypothetical protein